MMKKTLLALVALSIFVSTGSALSIDFIKPTPADESNVAYNFTVNTSITSSTDVKNVTAYINGNPEALTNNDSGNYWKLIEGTSEGLTDFYAEVYDTEGVSNTTATRSIIVDRSPPYVNIAEPNKSVYEGDNYVGVEVSDDPVGGADVTLYETNGTVLGSINDLDGSNSIQVFQDKTVNRCVIMYLKGVDDAGLTSTTANYYFGFNDTGELTTEDMNNCESHYTTETTDDKPTDVGAIVNLLLGVVMIVAVLKVLNEAEEVFN